MALWAGQTGDGCQVRVLASRSGGGEHGAVARGLFAAAGDVAADQLLRQYVPKKRLMETVTDGEIKMIETGKTPPT